jgi:glycosyl hydrolase family 16
MFRTVRTTAAVGFLLCGYPAGAAEPSIACPSAGDTRSFEEDFSTPVLDACRWAAVEENWGGRLGDEDYNGGVVPANVRVRDGYAELHALGNRYAGTVRGVASDGSLRLHGRRTGAAIVTRQRFLGGRFEARIAIAKELGVCSAMWTFFYEKNADKPARNHEIDIEFPGREDIDAPPSLGHVAFTTWTGLEPGESTTALRALPHPELEFHTFRFDWLPPTASSAGRLDYYVDDELLYSTRENVPSEPAPLWLGVWFPQTWAGTPDFGEAVMRVDWVKVSSLSDYRGR